MSNDIYKILNNFNKLTEQKNEPTQQAVKPKTQLQESIEQVNEKYMGFKKTVAAIKKGGSAENPEAVAAAIGRKKYGKEKFQKAAAAGKKLGEQSVNDMMETTDVTDDKPKSQGGTRKELLAKYKKSGDPKDAAAARRAGATQAELKAAKKTVEEGIKQIVRKLDPTIKSRLRRKADKLDDLGDETRKDLEYMDMDPRDVMTRAMDPYTHYRNADRYRRLANKKKNMKEEIDAIEEGIKQIVRKLDPTIKSRLRRKADKLDDLGDETRKDLEYMDMDPRDVMTRAMDPYTHYRNADRYRRLANKKKNMKEGEINEKAVSRAQQKFMGMVHAAKKGEEPASSEVAKVARGMTKKAARDFAATKHKGLPQHVNEAIHRAFQQGYTTNQIIAMLAESDEDYWKNLMKKPAAVGKTVHKGSYGTAYQGDDDDDDDGQPRKKPAVSADEKRGRGRPKGSKNREVKAGVKKAAPGEKRGRGRPAGSKNKVKESWIIENNKFIAEAFANIVKEAGGEVWTADMKDPKTGKFVPPPSPPDMGSLSAPPKQQRMAPPKPMKKKLDKKAEIDVDQPIAETDFTEMMRLAGLEEKLHGKQHRLDVDKDGDIEASDLSALRAGKKSMDEGDMEEGNAFGAAVRKAKADGIQPGETVKIGDKEYDLKESQIEECGYMNPVTGDATPEQKSHMNVTTNMSSDGNKSVTVNAEGNAAIELMQILSLAGIDKSADESSAEQVQVIPMEEKDPRYHANTTPEEEILPLETQLKGGDGEVAGKEKRMNKNGSARFSDNPLAVKNESISLNLMKEYEEIKVKS